jgi:hypothetical protein
MTSERTDLHARVTDQIVALVERRIQELKA